MNKFSAHLHQVRRVLACLFLCCLIISAPPQRMAAGATASEVCTSRRFFGLSGSSEASSYPGCTESSKIFWVPPCGPPLLEGNTGSSRAPLGQPGKNYIVSILYNRDPARRLTLNATSNKDIIVGSPGTSETINGGSTGDNAYLVGGGTSIISADGTSVTPGETTETDQLNLESNTIDFINIKPLGQQFPGNILVARRNASNGLVFETVLVNGMRTRRLAGQPLPIRGSGELLSSGLPSDMVGTCSAVASTLSSRLTIAAGPPASKAGLPLGMVNSISTPILAEVMQSSAQQDPITPSYEGVPVLQGFELDGSDIIVLSGDDFPVDTNTSANVPANPMPASLQLGGPQATLFSNGLAHQWLAKIFRKTDSYPQKPGSPRPEPPLVYYNKTGLLVLPQNRTSSGSNSKSGLVIAQLLDRSGLPLELNGSGEMRSFPARFVIFTPPSEKTKSNSNTKTTPPSKDALSR